LEDNVSHRQDRHGFLGPDSTEIIDSIRIGLVGVNGGGSHELLGHVGARRFAVYDPGNLDTESNLSRNVVSTLEDFDARGARHLVAAFLFVAPPGSWCSPRPTRSRPAPADTQPVFAMRTAGNSVEIWAL
jgi:hypothetical protein